MAKASKPAGRVNNLGAGKDGRMLTERRERTVETPERDRLPVRAGPTTFQKK